MSERSMTAKEFAKVAGISVQRVYALVAEYPDMPRTHVGRRMMFNAASLAFLQRRRARQAERLSHGPHYADLYVGRR